MNPQQASQEVAKFLEFLADAREQLKHNLVPEETPDVQRIRRCVEEHSVDDQGKPTLYQRYESALYDDARSMVTLWTWLEDHDRETLQRYEKLIAIEIDGLVGDRHPRKVFDRSPFGVAALVVGTVTLWMTFLKTYSGEDLGDLLLLIRFNWIVGAVWIVGLFVVIWYILKTHRNNTQLAFLSTLQRAIKLMQ